MDGKPRVTSLRLPEGLWRLFKRWCLDNDTSMQAVVEYLIREHLRAQPINYEKERE
jgi:hypothetical protein